MSSNEMMQYLFFTVVGALALTALWYIFIKAPQARSRQLEPWARKRGLTFHPPVSLGSHTTGLETSTLQGMVQGIPVTLRSSRLVNSRRAGINGTAELMLRATAPSPVSFSVTLAPGSARGAIPTGDPAFDANVSIQSDNPRAALAWLNPQLRAAVYALVANGEPLVCAYAGGETTLRFGAPVFEETQLDRLLALAVAAAYARLG